MIYKSQLDCIKIYRPLHVYCQGIIDHNLQEVVKFHENQLKEVSVELKCGCIVCLNHMPPWEAEACRLFKECIDAMLN